MEDLLIIYPHGLGDCIMLTPTLREYYKKFGRKLSVAIMKRFKSSEIFKNNPYVKNVFYVSDPWNDFKNPNIGFKEVIIEGNRIAKKNGIPKAQFLNQPPPTHKIYKNAELLGLKISNPKMEVYVSEDEIKLADEIIKSSVGDNSFGFIQTNTGAGSHKDLPDGFGEKWLKKNKGLNHFIEVGKAFKYNDFNINVQFEILNKSNAICVPDSVFYHAASAMDKNIDFVYFGRGKPVYDRVGNLNKNIKEELYFKIPKI